MVKYRKIDQAHSKFMTMILLRERERENETRKRKLEDLKVALNLLFLKKKNATKHEFY